MTQVPGRVPIYMSKIGWAIKITLSLLQERRRVITRKIKLLESKLRLDEGGEEKVNE